MNTTTLTNADARTLNRLRILTVAADAGVWCRVDGTNLACLMYENGAEIRVPGKTDADALQALGDFLCATGILTVEEIAWARNPSNDPGPRPQRV